jgi:chromosome segregation ATPase
LRAEIEDVRQLNTGLRAQVREKQSELARLHQDLDVESNAHSTKQRELQETHVMLDARKEELSSASKQLEEARKSLREQRAQVDAVRRDRDDLQLEVRSLQDTQAGVQRSITAKQLELRGIEDTHDRKVAEMEGVEANLTRLRNELLTIRSQVQDAKKEHHESEAAARARMSKVCVALMNAILVADA